MKRRFPDLAALAVAGIILASAVPASAGVNVNITIPLPGLVLPAPPGLIVVPGTNVYYPPEVGVDIFFYHGSWYRPYNGGWYIANGYNGPWRTVGPGHVPRALYEMPHNYRGMAPMHERLPYSDVRHNWRTWERERRWDNGRGHEDHGGHRGRGHGEGHGRHG